MAKSKKPQTVTPGEIRRLAKALGCQTQTDLADTLGVSQARISQILTGKHPVRPGALLTLIRQFQAQTQNNKPRNRTDDAVASPAYRVWEGNDDA